MSTPHPVISVIYQDHHLLIINKPAGIVVHPTYKNLEGTLWDALLRYLETHTDDGWMPPELPDEPAWSRAPVPIQAMLREQRREKQVQEEGLLPKPCLLHRLDKDTSGILALARTRRSCLYITRQFHAHTALKHYLTVVRRGAPQWAHPRTTLAMSLLTGPEFVPFSEGEVDLADVQGQVLRLDGPLQRDPEDRRRTIVGEPGQEAATMLRVLAQHDEFFLLEARLITGRTHQIRAHLAAFGYSIVGDPVYAPKAAEGTPAAALQRQFLHAHTLRLRRYPDEKICLFRAPLANDLQQWLRRYFPAGIEAIEARERENEASATV